MTGAAHTYDQIVWGPGNAQSIAENKRQGKKSCTKPATAELGCVSPLLIVPGDWTDVELEHVAAQIAGTVTNNNSYNCVAGKVLIIDGQWDLKDKFIGCVEAALARVPTRNPYYPGSKDRYSHLQSAYQERFEPIDQPSQDKAHLQVGRVKGLLNSEVDSD
ncbi:hypothetical protein SARC_11514 [Sphaeroforma arctica JP610]|uniref:Aldehyde dehydrogenase domain-containing protein n=1 Tax=Sphaeroforma arctica JP610 TaxID=667725 RepID=A0A0L0FGU1_9EUKA|nr:hypothetical protein SARC_11514 [Sphaeroforma arctica JP610]KNC75975.1 hypothetical protein SARC_11514 [Sphaeroforma arctica JP610]|eukprot:XP_014149877.1 hypothetical protein SARC_11514 [Sphaeroforma arctica JP610]